MTAAAPNQPTPPLAQPVTALHGVGPERAAQLARLDIRTIEELLLGRRGRRAGAAPPARALGGRPRVYADCQIAARRAGDDARQGCRPWREVVQAARQVH